MTQTAIQTKTRILPGRRIEVFLPEVEVGEEVELVILKTKPANALKTPSMLDFIQNVPPGPRPFATWEEYEKALQEEKEAWER